MNQSEVCDDIDNNCDWNAVAVMKEGLASYPGSRGLRPPRAWVRG